jgi:hypothetical protein
LLLTEKEQSREHRPGKQKKLNTVYVTMWRHPWTPAASDPIQRAQQRTGKEKTGETARTGG